MNKKELATVVVLILLIPVVLELDRRFVKPFFPSPEPQPAAIEEVEDEVRPLRTPAADPVLVEEPDAVPGVERIRDELVEAAEDLPGRPVVALAEQTVELANEQLTLLVGNAAAGILHVQLNGYEATLADRRARLDEEPWTPITFDFSDEPALSLQGGLMRRGRLFEMEEVEPGRALRFRKTFEDGELIFERDMVLGDGFVVEVTDRWISRMDSNIRLPESTVWLGRMLPLPDVSQRFGPFLGVDARHTGGEGVRHYVRQITRWVRRTTGVHEERINLGLDWLTAKNKFFTQVLTMLPGDAALPQALRIRAEAGTGDARLGMVQSGAVFTEEMLRAGDTLERRMSFYVGPMRLENLKELGQGQDSMIDVRLWRVFVPIGRLMMNGLNGLYGFTGNWGVSIILLTFFVRMLFWPLTQKGAENMKKMSEISPQIKEIREKYKSNPQKMQQATAALYKEHKVNPMAGCLPMFVQIPVFFSLYGVLRVAVELRFARFLWIQDLSEQEALFFLFGFPVNILPLAMGATMILQQRMTPNTMDEQQRKIMMIMPIVFLFISYNMPAGLLLYWTTSNLISIYQAAHTRKRQAKQAPAAAPTPAAAAKPLTKRKPGNKSGKR